MIEKARNKIRMINQYWYATNGRKMDTKGGIIHASHRYAKTNDKYIKDSNKYKKWIYPTCLESNSLYRCKMSQKWAVDNFEWEKKSNYDKTVK